MKYVFALLLAATIAAGCQPAITHDTMDEPAAISIEAASLEVMFWDDDATSVTYRVVAEASGDYHLSAVDNHGGVFYAEDHEGEADVRVYIDRTPDVNAVTFAISQDGAAIESVELHVPARVE